MLGKRAGQTGRRWAALAAAAVILFPAKAMLAQKSALAFWEPDAAKVDTVLGANPKKEDARYSFLRRSLVNYGCTGALMREQRAGKRGTNVICTLEGATPERILVLARFDDRGKDRPTWGDAVMLAMLYHALQAQPRQHTFVLAGLDGRDGEKAFLATLREPAQPPPAVAVVLDSLGMGPPLLHTDPPNNTEAGKAAAQTDVMVWNQAMKTRELMGIPAADLWPKRITGLEAQNLWDWQQWLFSDTLFNAVRETPGVLFFSNHTAVVDTKAFHQDFDFVAWMLCELDSKLPAPAAKMAGNPAPAPAKP